MTVFEKYFLKNAKIRDKYFANLLFATYLISNKHLKNSQFDKSIILL